MNATKILEDLREVDLFNMNSANYGNHKHYISQLEDLVRQQSDRIAELEKQLAFMEGEYPEPTIASKMKEFANLEQALNRIAELEKQLNLHKNAHHKCVEILQEKQSEPVAWLARNQLINKYIPISLEEKEKTLPHVLQLYDDWIPLYTTPQTKPLSDEEINEIIRIETAKDPVGIGWNLAFNTARAIEAKVRGEK